MTPDLKRIEEEFLSALGKAQNAEALDDIRVRYLGKKGALTGAMKGIGGLPESERPKFGALINKVRGNLETRWESAKADVEAKELTKNLKGERLDLGLPGRRPKLGVLHPLTKTERRIVGVFSKLGFSVEIGPEVETDFYNFGGLNFPPDHPARDMQDTLFLENGLLLRTHTSPVQIRTMEKFPPPIRVVMPGRVYRHDDDLRRSPVFHQVEGLCVGTNITFSHLKGTLEAFVRMLFGPEIKARFRPSFFPFTEPSAEVDMQCSVCKGKGCRVCKESGWVEILGCGMVHPSVFEAVGRAWKAESNPYDPEKVSGFAFGMGIERIAMVLHSIDNIRLFYENDLRFLDQFGGKA